MSKIDYEAFYDAVSKRWARCGEKNSELLDFAHAVSKLLYSPPQKPIVQTPSEVPAFNTSELTDVERILFETCFAAYLTEGIAIDAVNRASKLVLKFRKDAKKDGALSEETKELFSSLTVAR